jgi:tryptophan-rich sensory protein
MPIAAVLFGWPAVLASGVLLVVGVVGAWSRVVFLGAVVACPFLFYLFLSPRLGWAAPIAGVMLFAAAIAVGWGHRLAAAALLAPYVGLVGFVAYLVWNQPAG